MSTLATVRAVAGREFRSRMLARSSIVSLAVMLAVIVIGGFVGNYFLDRADGPETTVVALTPETADLGPALEQTAAATGMTLELVQATERDARVALTDADGAPVGREDPLDAAVVGAAGSPVVLVNDPAPDQVLINAVAGASQTVALGELVGELGGDPADFGAALAQAAPRLEVVAEEGGFDAPTYLVAMLAIAYLLFALLLTGTAISTGVVEEKASRVVEILLATIKPSQLLAGKVLGIGLYGLVEVTILAGATAGVAAALGLAEGLDLDIGATLGWLVVWFLVGYAGFALLWGGFASLVSRQEEIGAVTTPVTFLVIVPFYVAIYLVPSSPDGTATTVLSYLPFFAPFLMPVRQAFGAVETWELLLAVGVSLAVVPLFVWVAGRVYARAALHTGGRMKLMDALRG